MQNSNTSAILSQDDIYKSAVDFFNNKQKSKLENLFSQYLKSSYDIRLWKLYLQHTKNLSLPHGKMLEVYYFILQHFEHGYNIFDFVTGCISEIDQSDESDTIKHEEIRKVYHQFLKLPMENLTKLWIQYEEWEFLVNRLNARTHIEANQPLYLNALSLYQKISQCLKKENFYEVLDIELENLMKLLKSQFDTRIAFIFKYLETKSNKEHLEILKTIYVPKCYDIKKDAKTIRDLAADSVLLSIWFSFYFKQDFFKLEDGEFLNISLVNYMHFIVQTKGMDVFRERFDELIVTYEDSIEYQVYICAAEIEFMFDKENNRAYELFSEAPKKFGECNLLNEKIVELLIKYNKTEELTILFKKLAKTEKMYNIMTDYMFKVGNIAYFKDLLLQKESAKKNKELLKKVPAKTNLDAEKGSKAVLSKILSTFEYLNLSFAKVNVDTFDLSKIRQIPEEENYFTGVNLDKLIEIILKS